MAKYREFVTSDSEAVINWLHLLGIEPMTTTRVIIDIQVGDAVRVYTTGIGQKDAFMVEPPPEFLGAEIVKAE